jgi:hypothetical protein
MQDYNMHIQIYCLDQDVQRSTYDSLAVQLIPPICAVAALAIITIIIVVNIIIIISSSS